MPHSSAELVIFDCDGVLVDSEPIAARMTAENVRELGLPMTPEQAKAEFLGDTFANIIRTLEQRLGRPVPQDWPERCQARLFEAFRRELKSVPGAKRTVEHLLELGLKVAVGSQGAPEKMHVTLSVTGLLPYFEGRVFSAATVARPKPAPDLFLHIASALGVAPERAVVVEDSTRGVQAAKAAGMRVFGYTGTLGAAPLAAAGAETIDDLMLIPQLLPVP
jgi:HAD superfamily hydrolase (TIGR01509 family)